MFVGYADSLRTGSVGEPSGYLTGPVFAMVLRVSISTTRLCAPRLPMHRLCPTPELPKHHERWGTIEVRHNFTFLSVENDELICVHVRDIKTAMRSVETLESKRTAGWQGHVRNLASVLPTQGCRRSRGCCAAEYRTNNC